MGYRFVVYWSLFFASAMLLQAQEKYVMVGNASRIDANCYHLTNENTWENASVWYQDKITLNKPFDISFSAFFGCLDYGADGIVFALQQQSSNAGSAGGGIGIQGVKPSISVEFDTYYNAPFSDIVADHIAVIRNGNIDHNTADNLAGPVAAAAGNIEDCKKHEIRISWNPASQKLLVYFDCELKINLTYDIIKNVFNNNPNVFWGFTAATGGAFNRQEVCINYTNIVKYLNDTAVCPGSLVQLDGGIGKNYLWSPETGLSDKYSRNPIATPTVTTTYIVKKEDDCNSVYYDTVTVKMKTLDKFLDSVQNPKVCEGQKVKITPVGNFFSYLWSTGETTRTIEVTQSGKYWLHAKNQQGCQGTDTVRVQYTSTVTKLRDTFLCRGSTLQLDGGAGNDFLWQNGATMQDSNKQKPWVTPDATTVYYFKKTDTCGVVRQDTLTVTVIDINNFLDTAKDTLVCEGQLVALSSRSPFSHYLWSNGDTTISIQVGTNGSYWLKVTDAYGCQRTDTIKVKDFLKQPVTGLVKEIKYWSPQCDDSVIVLTARPGYEYLWSTGDISESITATAQGKYWLKVSAGICEVTDTVTIKKLCPVLAWVPNAFLPGGKNDTWKVTCEGCTSVSLRIYNRWGELLFESQDLNFEWDGTYKGTDCADGVYFYILQYAGEETHGKRVFNTSGNITLLR